MDKKKLIQGIYQSFNARDIDAILRHFAVDVKWPNGWEGGYVHGHDAVRDYWTRQWKELNPAVTPIAYKQFEDGRLKVHVHQLVKDLDGKVLHDGIVFHCYTFYDEKIQQMEIEPG